MADERSRHDDDRDEDRTGERMRARNEANRQAQDPAAQGLPTPAEGSVEREGMGQARQNDGGGPDGEIR